MTSVGVAWGIAWNTVGVAFKGSDSFGVQIVRRGDDVGEGIGWTVSRAGWPSEDGPCVENLFLHISKPELHVAQRRTVFSVDVEAEFVRLAGDAASRRALARHRPLLLSPDGRYVECWVTLAGWPLHCLGMENACTREFASRSKRAVYVAKMAIGSLLEKPEPKAPVTDPVFNLLPHYSAVEVGEHLLPTFPLWPGLLANTAIYGGAWAVLIGVPVLLRRWLRARRGGCPQCGYSREGLKVDAPCPECGRTPPAAHDATPTPAAPTAR
jgi:hypothetical protein